MVTTAEHLHVNLANSPKSDRTPTPTKCKKSSRKLCESHPDVYDAPSSTSTKFYIVGSLHSEQKKKKVWFPNSCLFELVKTKPLETEKEILQKNQKQQQC